jgi:glycosyltransferase involved in cell wall biosynthesis
MKSNNLSIIMATYNRASLVHKSINSVLQQTNPNWQLIIVDDGSSDNTFEVISNYTNDKRIICHTYNKNRGPSYARNIGVRLSNNEYVAFLDDDDKLVPDAVNQMLTCINEDMGLHWGHFFVCLDADSHQKIGKWPMDNSVITYADVLLNRYYGEAIPLVKRQSFEYYEFCEEFMGYERILWYSILKYLGPIKMHDKPLRLYSQDTPGGSIINPLTIQDSYFINSAKQSIKYLELFGDDLFYFNPKQYAYELMKIGLAYLYLKQYIKSVSYLTRAVKINPNYKHLILLFLSMFKIPIKKVKQIVNKLKAKP